MPQTKDVSTSSGGTLTVPALTAALGQTTGLAPALPPGATVSRGVAQTLQQLADAHNAVHGNDRKKRADLRALRAAYRRGAGRKPRAGRSRRQEGLARAQAHLAALAGKELPAEYAADRELLPGEEKRLAVLTMEGTVAEPPSHLKALGVVAAVQSPAPPAPEQKSATPVETKTWSDEARAAALLARREHAKTKVGELKPGQHVQFTKPGPGGLSDPVDVAGVVHHVTGVEGSDKVHEVHLTDGTSHRVMGTVEATSADKPDPAELARHAHAATAAVLDAPATGEARTAAHDHARDAHLAAADAHKAAGDDKAALEHLSLADHHRDSAEAYRDDEAEHHFPVGSRVAAPNGKEGHVVAHSADGTAIRHDDGSLAVHKTGSLMPGSDNTLRGTVAARDTKPGDFVWDSTHPEGGYRVQGHEVTGSGADEVVHHSFHDAPLGTGHRYHHADAQLRVVRGADASHYSRHT